MNNKIKIFFASIAPGIFLIGFNIGTGSITTMASAGAAYGMELMWPLLLSCIFTYFLIITFGRYTAVTKDTILSSYRKYFGKPVTLFVLASLLVSEIISSMGVMGVISEIIQEWSKPFFPEQGGISMILTAVFFASLLCYLFYQGKQSFFEKILGIFVGLMGLCFIITMFMVIPEPGEIIRGMIPKIPQTSEKFLLIAGMVGTTMGAVLYVVRSILVQEKGWETKDLKLAKRDALISASVMFLLSVSVMACAAGTLYPLGITVENAVDMVNLMEPIAGRFAISVFVAGIVAAGLSSLFPIYLLAPWLIADYSNKPRNMKNKKNRIMVLIAALFSLWIPIFGGRPVFIMILSQSLTIIVTPLILILMMILLNKKSVMGEKYKINMAWNIGLSIILLFTIIMAISGVIGIIGSI